MKRAVVVALSAVVTLPELVFAATPRTFSDLAGQIVQLLGSATTDLIVLAIVIYFWGVSSSLFRQGEKGHSELRRQLVWGVVVIFLAVSIWGVVQLLQSTIFGSDINGTVGNTGLGTCSSLTGCQPGQ